MTTNSQAGLEDKILTSASVWALSIWPRSGLYLVNLVSKMCYQMLNNIGCIHFVVVSLQHSLQMLSTLMWDINSFMCCCHCRHVFLVRNIYMWPASTLTPDLEDMASASPRPRGSCLDLDLDLASASASTFWPRLTSLLITSTMNG